MPVPPKGVVLETAEDIRLLADDINAQSVRTHAMPPSNITDMQPEERAALAASGSRRAHLSPDADVQAAAQ